MHPETGSSIQRHSYMPIVSPLPTGLSLMGVCQDNVRTTPIRLVQAGGNPTEAPRRLAVIYS